MSDPFVDFLRENWPLFVVVAALTVALYQIRTLHKIMFNSQGELLLVNKNENYNLHAKAMGWKKALFHEDGTLQYVTRREYEKKMQENETDNEGNLTTKEHEKLCTIAALQIAQKVGDLMDKRFSAFEEKLFKELKLNGYPKRSETLL